MKRVMKRILMVLAFVGAAIAVGSIIHLMYLGMWCEPEIKGITATRHMFLFILGGLGGAAVGGMSDEL